MIGSTQWTTFHLAKLCPLRGITPSICTQFNRVYYHCMLTQSTQLECSCWLSPKPANWHSLYPCRNHTSSAMKVRGCAPSNPAAKGNTLSCTPICTFNTGGALKICGFFPQNLFYIHVSGDFNTFGPFPGRIVLFQVSGTVYDACRHH